MTGALRTALGEIARKKHRYLFFDFDGTLSPIVDRPEDAAAHPDVLDPLRKLAAQPRTVVAVVTGRPVSDIRARLPVETLVVAAVHGLVIDGPSLHHTPADVARLEPVIQAAASQLERRVGALEGLFIENKGLTVAVHYRRAGLQDAERVVALTRRMASETAGIRALEGKKVIELRPDIDWDKGKAVELILETLGTGKGDPETGVLYVGDDRTDEDAFRTLEGKAVTVRVGSESEPTAARFRVRDPDEVVGLVREILLLIEQGEGIVSQNRNVSS